MNFKRILGLPLSIPYRLWNSSWGKGQKQSQILLGNIHNINSAQLGENRRFNVYLPNGYRSNPLNKYPVLYLLDGGTNEHFIHFSGLVQFLNLSGILKPVIVVGIENVNRNRDFTFPSSQIADQIKIKDSGGGEAFLNFVERELLPFIENTYRTNKIRTLAGLSLGGLFATEVLWRKPTLFHNYMIVSPSLWWNGGLLLKDLELHFHPPLPMRTNVFIAVGNEGRQMEHNATHLGEVLRNKGVKHLKVFFEQLPNENHHTIFHNAAYRMLTHIDKEG